MTNQDASQDPAAAEPAGGSPSPAGCGCAGGTCASSDAGTTTRSGKRKLLVAGLLAVAAIGVPLALKARPGSAQAHGASTGHPCCEGMAEQGSCEHGGVFPMVHASADVRHLPKLVDLGTTTCAPCKAMLGVIGELEHAYPDDLAVEFVNVQEQQDAAEKYGIQIIPTQVFLGADGREVYRHTGFLSTEAIVKKWRELGYPLGARPQGS